MARTSDLKELAESERTIAPDLSGALFGSEEGFSQIIRPDGSVVASTLPPSSGAAIDRSRIDEARRAQIKLDDVRVATLEGGARVLAAPARGPGGSYVLIAGTSTDNRDEALSGITHAFLLGAPLALLIASGLGYLLARRSLAPVERMRARAGRITLEESGERLPLPRAADEIHRLGETLNTMLGRIEGSLERQRVFVADASHELRTPLAVLRAELELAQRPGRSEQELRAAVDSAADEVDRLSRLAADLLVIARADQGRLQIRRERVDLHELSERIAERFRPRGIEMGRDIRVEVPAGSVGCIDVLRVEQALGNLVDNALEHGSGTVRIIAEAGPDETSFTVGDEGSGFPAGFKEQAFERFSRADEGRPGGGAGLGLAIVRSIATGHGGDVEILETGSTGSTAVRMMLPGEA